MAETIVLDPTAVATGRTQLDITNWVSAAGIDWGDAVFEAITAQSERGDLVVDGRLPNRIITVPLVLRTVGATSFATIRQSVQQKVGLFQREGGYVMRQVGATPLYADVVNASLHLSGSWLQAVKDADIEATLTLECVPDWYGAEVDLGDNVETTLPELIFTDTAVAGNYPGRARIVVDNDSASNQNSLLWALRSRYYSSASTARLAYAGTALHRLDTAGTASGAVVHTDLATDWTPVLGTNLGGTAYLTHQGTYRAWAAVASTANGDDVSCRFVWDVGDLVNPVQNPAVTVPTMGGTFLLDLGQIRLDATPAGTHRWQGAIQAKGAAGGEGVQISRLWFQPLDESAGYLRAPLTGDIGMSSFAARDAFAQTSGTLTGKVLPVGGTWAGAGDTDDFTIDTSGHTAQRTATSDSAAGAIGVPRFAIAGTATYTSTVVQVDFKYGDYTGRIGPSPDGVAVVARYTDTSNYLGAMLIPGSSPPGQHALTVFKAVSGTFTYWDAPDDTLAEKFGSTWFTVRLRVDSSGQYWMWFGPTGSLLPLYVSGYDSALATGGALASGKVGFFDMYWQSTALTRSYDNFVAWVPPADAVIYAGQSLELRTEGFFREDTGGTAYGPVSHAVGDLPRLPPAGLESRTVEVFLKPSRGDLETLPDTAADDISARVFYRPSYLYVT